MSDMNQPSPALSQPTTTANTPAPGPEDDQATSSTTSFALEVAKSFGIALVIAFILKTFVIQAFYIPSGSMLNTLQLNDQVVVQKIGYHFTDPQRGQIIVFRRPDLEPDAPYDLIASAKGFGEALGLIQAEPNKDLIKRIIGLPGDTIEIRAGETYVNGVKIDEPYVLPDPNSYGPFEVPEGHYFVMGDNRSHSLDSRLGLGTVPRENIIGHAWLIIWPWAQMSASLDATYANIPDA